MTWNLLHHIHKAKFSLAAVDTGSLICHQLVVTPHLLSPACRQASPTPPGIAQPTQQTALNTLLSPSKNGACVLMKIQCGKASDTPVEHSVAPLFIPQYLLGTYYIPGLILATVDTKEQSPSSHNDGIPLEKSKFICQVVTQPFSTGIQLKSEIGKTTFSILKQLREQAT